MVRVMRKKIKKFVKFAITLLFVVSGIMLVYTDQSDNIKKHIDEVKIKQSISQDSDGVDFDKLQNVNKDIVAWIKVPGTKVDYPVLKTEDNNFYLSHDIDKSYSQFGSIFLDQRYYNLDILKADNLIVYGHNMGQWNDTMFGTLMKFKQKDFCEEHNEIYLYKGNEKIIYNIVSVIKTTTADEWYNFINYGKESTFNEKITYARDKSMYDFTKPEHIRKRFITLSTCDYDGAYKILVIGVKKVTKSNLSNQVLRC